MRQLCTGLSCWCDIEGGGSLREENVDVLVVGGGPVGCIAAKFSAQGGARTLIAEKRREIGIPVRCGEGIAPDFFAEIGLVKNDIWVRNKVEGARFISPAGHIWVVEGESISEEVGLVIDRDKFDKAVAMQALDAGARMVLRTHIEDLIVEDDRVLGASGLHMGEKILIRAKIVIAADGFESMLASRAGIDTRLAKKDIETCIQYTMAGVRSEGRYCDFYFGNRIVPGGYIWIFPKSETELNVGLGLLLSKIDTRGMVKELLDAFIANHSDLKDGSPISMITGGVSVSMPIERTTAHGFMVVGDAARMVDPLSGGGLANGMIAGKMAGEVAANAVRKRDLSADFLNEYDKQWRKRLEEKMYRNYMAKEMLLRQTDDTMDKVIATLGSTKMDEVGTFEIIQAISEKHPEVMKEIEKYFL